MAALYADWISFSSQLGSSQPEQEAFQTFRSGLHRQMGIPFAGNMVPLDIVAEQTADQVFDELGAIGFEQVDSIGRVASGWLPIESLLSLAETDGVLFATSPSSYDLNAGDVSSQGDLALGSEDIRSLFSLDGHAIMVGVLSSSYDRNPSAITRASDDIESGDLPGINNPFGYTEPVLVLHDDVDGTPSDEGRAMLQIVHDVAPGSRLAFSSIPPYPITGLPPGRPFVFQTQFANRIRELADAGAKVIVDDITFNDAPMFQDGFIAQAVDEVVEEDVVYVTSAGNEGRRSYESDFMAGPLITFGDHQETAHVIDTDTGSYRQRVTIPVGQTIELFFQWDEPFASMNPGGPGSSNDLNILLFKANTNTLVDWVATNNIGKNPLEVLEFDNLAVFGTTEFDIVLTHRSGPQPGLLKYFDPNGNMTFDNNTFTNSGTIFGHANALGAITVGAADYRNTPVNGVDPPLIQTDTSPAGASSVGGTPILFDVAGNRLAMSDARLKPDIVAPDNVNTTFFLGEFLPQFPQFDPEPDGLPNFAGTSAAAPHIAGLAALMLQANPELTPQDVKDALTSTAINMNDPFDPQPTEIFDYGTGYGFVHGLNALRKVLPPKVLDVIVSDVEPDTSPGGTPDTYTSPDSTSPPWTAMAFN